MGYINRSMERHSVPRSDILLTDSLTYAIGMGGADADIAAQARVCPSES